MKDSPHHQKKYGMQEEIKSEGRNLHYSNNIFYLKKKSQAYLKDIRRKEDSGFVTHPSNKDLVQSDGGGARL